jgi:predicted lipoprotein with Yx(FWY)xxD motif
VKTGTSSLGRILVDGKSHTLYLFEKDKRGRSACSGACAANWPPLLTKDAPKAGASARASLLGTIRRSDGTTQVTYNKHPLYTFVGDAGRRGATSGEGVDAFGARWYVVAAKGTAKTGSD